MPPNTIYVGRPSKYGNPFVCDGNHSKAVELFRKYLLMAKEENIWYEDYIAPLRGHNLACWCKVGESCHADVLLKLANR